MRNLSFAAAIVILVAAGCASDKTYSDKSVTKMQPGFGAIVATFKYIPGESAFPPAQILTDAKYLTGRLSAIGREPFIVYTGGNTALVGIRASSHRLAEALKAELESKKSLALGDGNTLPITTVEIKNISELQLYAQDRIP
jgi:hypothetical protein